MSEENKDNKAAIEARIIELSKSGDTIRSEDFADLMRPAQEDNDSPETQEAPVEEIAKEEPDVSEPEEEEPDILESEEVEEFEEEEPKSEAAEPKKSKAEKDFIKKQYQFQAELQRREDALLEREREIALLRAEKEQALQSTLHHFDDANKTRMEQLDYLYDKAIDTNDKQLFRQVLDARDELRAEKRRVDELYSQRSVVPQQDYGTDYAPAPQAPAAISATQKHRANVWHNKHPELVSGNSAFNPKLWESVKKFATDYNNDLVQEGNLQEIYSDSYIKLLDEHLQNEKSKFSPQAKQKITTVPPHAPVASAKGGGLRAPVSQAKKVVLEPCHDILITHYMATKNMTREQAEQRCRTNVLQGQQDLAEGRLNIYDR